MIDMKPITLTEAAEFLRMSKSALYQNPAIPRYRRPGSRVLLFDQEELETWLRQGRVIPVIAHALDKDVPVTTAPHAVNDVGAVVDISQRPIYHRNARYR